MRRTFIAILLVAAFLVGGGIIASVAYQAGLSTAVTTAVTESGATVVAPVAPVVPVYGAGWGWGGPGWGILGFLGFLFFLFLFFAVIRFAFFAGRGGGPRGGSWGGPGHWDRERWENRANDWFEEHHRRAHDPGAVDQPAGDRPDA